MKLKIPGIVTFAAALVAAAVTVIALIMTLVGLFSGGVGASDILLIVMMLGAQAATAVVLVVFGLRGLFAALGSAEEAKMVEITSSLFLWLAIVSIAGLVLNALLNVIVGGAFIMDIRALIFDIVAIALFIGGRFLYKGNQKLVGVILLMIVPVFMLLNVVLVAGAFGGLLPILDSIANICLVGGAVCLLTFVLLNVIKK